MKKLVTLFVCILLSACMTLGLVACAPREDKPEDDPNAKLEAGYVENAQTAKSYVATKADTRAKAYTAYKADGTKIGDYNSLANAANSAVGGGGLLSYVTKLNDTTKMFINKEGYYKQKDENDPNKDNDECFWFYDNGTSLESHNCWDNTDTLGSLKGQSRTTLHTQDMGTSSTQSYNGYQVLDEKGNASEGLDAPVWELSSTLDAAVLAFPTLKGGMVKSTYEIDLSNVKITPAYTTGESADPVYAFVGFYVWQDWYVINVGIACDVKTGNWYPYIGTSRDNSASDTVYSTDTDNCVMTSTWNDAGYFKPDETKLTLTFETKTLEDADGEYQVDDFTAETSAGAKYTRRLTAGTINEYFPGKPIEYVNNYVFVAGLDVRNDVVTGVNVSNVDYFNGAKFENLVVTKAEGYVPTEEEMSNEVYGSSMGCERGKSHNLLLATGGSDLIDHTVLNNYMCTSYKAENEHDVYNFSFDRYEEFKPAEASALSGTAKDYQDKLNSLKDVTADNVFDFAATIEELEAVYAEGVGDNSSLAIKYHNVLDFTNYLKAKPILVEAAKLDDAGEAFVAKYKKFPSLATYRMVGWAADSENVGKPGYIYSDYLAMKALLEDYAALEPGIQSAVLFHVNKTDFNDWKTFVEELTALEAAAAYQDKDTTFELFPIDFDKKDKIQYNSETALKQALYWALQIKNGGKWEGTPTNTMEGDNSWFQSVYVVNCVRGFESFDLTLPTWVSDILEAIGYDNFCDAYDSIYETVALAQAIKTNNWTKLSNLSAEQIASLNQYWVSSYKINGILSWNWNSGEKFETFMGARVGRVVEYAGGTLMQGEIAFLCRDYFAVVAEFLTSNGYQVKENGWGVTVETIEVPAA